MCTISQKWVWQAIRMTFHRATVQRVYFVGVNFHKLCISVAIPKRFISEINQNHFQTHPGMSLVTCTNYSLMRKHSLPSTGDGLVCLFSAHCFRFTKAGWSSIDSGTCFDHHGCNKDEMGQLPISWNITTSITNLQKKFISLYF